MPIPDTPQTRGEQYLNAMATGDTSGIPDHPHTREEQYLDYIAKNGGGGGGSGLPSYTNADVNKGLFIKAQSTTTEYTVLEECDVVTSVTSASSVTIINTDKFVVGNPAVLTVDGDENTSSVTMQTIQWTDSQGHTYSKTIEAIEAYVQIPGSGGDEAPLYLCKDGTLYADLAGTFTLSATVSETVVTGVAPTWAGADGAFIVNLTTQDMQNFTAGKTAMEIYTASQTQLVIFLVNLAQYGLVLSLPLLTANYPLLTANYGNSAFQFVGGGVAISEGQILAESVMLTASSADAYPTGALTTAAVTPDES